MTYAAAFKAVLQYVGAASLIYTTYKVIDFNLLWLLPKKSLSPYQRQQGAWALVTGASAGIGRGCAEELAARGFNVILLGHLTDQLEQVQKAINKESPAVDVRIVTLDVTTATNAEIEQSFARVSSLHITVLVNNVGGVPIAHPALRSFAEQSPEELDRTINLNARFMTQCTRFLYPILTKNGPSIMMNLSSIGRLGMPLIVPYSATKAYVAGLSRGLAREAQANGDAVDVVAVLPVEVATETNYRAQGPVTPTSRQFARAMMDYVPRAASRGILELCPHWPHAVQMAMMEARPEKMFLAAVLGSFNKKKALLKAE